MLVASLRALEAQVAELDVQIAQRAKADPVARRLLTIPGIGPITATAITALAPPTEAFTAGRHFAAWIGLTPKERSTGGKQKLGSISKMGERTLRRLLTIGASAVVKQAVLRGAPAGSWLAQMLARKPRMLVIVALDVQSRREVVWWKPEADRLLCPCSADGLEGREAAESLQPLGEVVGADEGGEVLA